MGNVFRGIDSFGSGNYEVVEVYPTGIVALDKALGGGLPVNKVALFAARTSHGKTATAMRLAYNLAMQDRIVNVLWLEDDLDEFTLRSISLLANEPLIDVMGKYRRRGLAPVVNRIPQSHRDLWYTNASVDRMDRPSVADVCGYIRGMTPGAVLIVDHLGEINWGQGMKHEAIGDGFRKIRAAGLEAKVLVVCMTQLNRDWDRRKAASDTPDKVRPCLSDIENSGQLEQAARVCAILEKMPENELGMPAYAFHLFKPNIRGAICRWDEATCTPDNLPAVPVGENIQPDLKLPN